jgi:hypothetical protein
MFHTIDTITQGDSKDAHHYACNNEQVSQVLLTVGTLNALSSENLETKQKRQLDDDEELLPIKRNISTDTVTYFEEELQEETCEEQKRSVQETAALKSRYGMMPAFQEWGNDDTEFHSREEASLPKFIGA